MLRRCALGATVLLVGIALTFAAWRTVSAAGGTVTVGPDLEFHDGASSSSNTTVNAGDAVVFTWSGALPHSVTADDGSFDSGVQTSGTYSSTFSTPGTYRYYCSVHGGVGGIGMSGTITVLAASTPTATATSAAATSTNTPASTPSPTPTVAPTGTAAATGTASAPTATSTARGTAAAVMVSSTPRSLVGAGGALPSAGSGGQGAGTGWGTWAAVALAAAGLAGVGGALWARRRRLPGD